MIVVWYLGCFNIDGRPGSGVEQESQVNSNAYTNSNFQPDKQATEECGYGRDQIHFCNDNTQLKANTIYFSL